MGFKLDPFYRSMLEAQGSVFGMSAGAYARKLVIQSLEDSTSLRIERELRRTRESLGALFYALLTTKLGSSPAEAKAIVDRTILKD